MDRAEAEGEALVAHYARTGRGVAAKGTRGQLEWLRSRRALTLSGDLLPGGRYPFGLVRMFSDLQHGADGDAFERACEELEDFWYSGLGIEGWDWQLGFPAGWLEVQR